jgi:tetratricopeptide (TPR) repeat protein
MGTSGRPISDRANADRVQNLFAGASELPSEQRGGYLDAACKGDAALRREVESLLKSHDEAGAFLAEPTADFGTGSGAASGPAIGAAVGSGFAGAFDQTRLASALQEGPGTRIGNYKLLQLIGEGGFGSVFMAQQEQPVQRKVALKIIKLGMDTRQVVARFEQERQALAMMDHTNIAKVLDAGATESGRPYFVMELVKGDPIVEYCDKNNLSITDRLELFAQVCTAVQHAHTKGIIHRDIKPSNILVSVQDGRPHAKVIDFGIAKATNATLTEKTLFTEHRQLIGTPEYMSPEQAEGSLDIDTRTDVYSLGVLLYELLTGTTPFSSKELRSAAYAELQRIIREVDPPIPSTRISRNSDTIVGIAAKRDTEPRKLGLAIRGELDWIVMKALEKDRRRRYETANGLAMDVRRYISGEAISAAPPGAAYRVQKFVRRHRGMVIAGTMVAAALVLGVVGTSLGLLEATRQRAVAEANAEKALAEANRATLAEGMAQTRLGEAEATVRFLDEMLASADPSAMGKDMTVRKVLDTAASDAGKRFGDRPLVAARLHGTIGRTYLSLGVYPEGEEHLREQLRIRTAALGTDHPQTCTAVNDLGMILVKAGKTREAELHLKEAIVHHEALFGRKGEITVQSIDNLAQFYVGLLRSPEAEPLLREVLEARTQTPGKDMAETVVTLNALATLYADTERFDEARSAFADAIAMQERLTGKDHPYVLEIRSNMAWLEFESAMKATRTDKEAAKPFLERARVIGEEVWEAKKRVLGEEHQSTLSTMNNLVLVYQHLGMKDLAEKLRREDVAITIKVLGEEHPDTVVSLANLGAMLRDQGKFDEAIVHLERAVSIARRVHTPEHEGLGFTLAWYGSSLGAVGRFQDGLTALTEARGIFVKVFGEEHAFVGSADRDLMRLYDAWEKAEPGKGYAEKAQGLRASLEARKAKQGG